MQGKERSLGPGDKALVSVSDAQTSKNTETAMLSRALGITALFLEQGAKMGTIQSVHSSQVDEQVLVTEER